jgi:hypothetical protein
MRSIKVAVSVLAVATMIVAERCAPIKSQPRQSQTENAVASGAPVIESARPDSVLVLPGAVVEVTLFGTGFAPGKPGQNTVHFGTTALKQVPATSDGRQIVFAIPEMVSRGGEAPPSALRPGSYNVSVETSSGTSNAVTVRVFR